MEIINPWTDAENDLLKSLLDKMPYKDMEKYFVNRRYSYLRRRVSSMNLKNNYVYHKYFQNNDFFSVPNILNSYYAGILSADGCISKNRNVISWNISIKDRNILDQFIINTGFTGNYYHHLSTSPSTGNISEMVKLEVTCAEWKRDLNKSFNVIPQKTYRLLPPNLDKDILKYSFLCGAIDGDGSICFVKNRDFYITYTSCSFEIVKWIKGLIEKDFSISKNKMRKSHIGVRKGKGADMYMYRISGVKTIKLLQLIKTLPVPMLQRKWSSDQVNRALELYKNKFPYFFGDDKNYSFDKNGMIVKPDFGDKDFTNLINKSESSLVLV